MVYFRNEMEFFNTRETIEALSKEVTMHLKRFSARTSGVKLYYS